MGIVTRIVDFLARRRRSSLDPEVAYRLKQEGLERVLGPMHEYVGHAIIPYEVGGAVDMYYFPQPDGTTAFATMELLSASGDGPRRSRIGTYELVAFTRHRVTSPEPNPAFEAIERRTCGIFTVIGRYSQEAVLNPLETCDIPGEDGAPGKSLVFDEYAKPGVPFTVGRRRHGLLLCIEVHPSELAFARAHGTQELLRRLKEAGHYPCSDLDRPPVV